MLSVLAAFARSPYFSTVFTRKNGVFILTATALACASERKTEHTELSELKSPLRRAFFRVIVFYFPE